MCFVVERDAGGEAGRWRDQHVFACFGVCQACSTAVGQREKEMGKCPRMILGLCARKVCF